MSLLNAYEERTQSLSDDMTSLAGGDINPAQMALRAGGGVAGMAGDVVGAAVEPFVPKIVEEGIGYLVKGIMKTGPAKIALKWMEDNPEHAKDIMAGANIAGMMPLGATAKSLASGAKAGVERVAKNAPIELPGFYGNGLFGQVAGMASAVPSALYQAGTEFMSPKGIARSEAGISNQTRNVAQQSIDGKAAIDAKGLLDEHLSKVENKGKYDSGVAKEAKRVENKETLGKYDGAPSPSKAEQKFMDMPEAQRSKEFPTHSEAEVARLTKASREVRGNAEKIQDIVGGAWAKLTGKELPVKKPKTRASYESFASGQIEYANLMEQQLMKGTRSAPRALKDMFNDTGIIESGQFSRETLKKAFSEYKPEMWKGVVDDEMIDMLTGIVDEAWTPSRGMKLTGGDRQGKMLVIKHPSMWDDFTQESRVAGSKLNQTIHSKKMEPKVRRAYGGKGFEAPDDLKEFAALDSLVTANGRKLDSSRAEAFLETKAKLREGNTVSPAEIKKYEATKKELDKVSSKFKTDSQGRIYRASNHKSSSKTMGGVQNTTIFDQNGNIINLIHDEHDLFGMNLPWQSRMINMSTPQVHNVFTGSKNVVDQADKTAKIKYLSILEDRYGANVAKTKAGTPNTTKASRSNALEEAIVNFQPRVNAGHVMRSGAVAGPRAAAQVGLLGAYAPEEEK